MTRHLFALFAAALALGTLVAPARAADPYEINVIAGLTGNYAFVGNGLKEGLEGYESVVNKSGGIDGRPIKFVFSDDQSSPQIAVQLVNGLIAKNVPVFIGPTGVANCSAVAALVKNGPVMYCLSPGVNPTPGGYMFSVSVGPADLQVAEMNYIRERGFKRIAIIASTDGAGVGMERYQNAALALPENKDIKVVAFEHFGATDVSATAQMTRIKAADPQMVLVLSTGAALGNVLRSARDAGVDVPFMIPNSNATYPQMKAYADFMPKQAYFPNQTLTAPDATTDPGVRSALKLYTTTMLSMGLKPDIQGMGWDAGLIVVAALKKAGLAANADQIRDAIDGFTDLPGATGRYDFKAIPQRGIGVNGVITQEWDPSKGDWVAVGKPGGGVK